MERSANEAPEPHKCEQIAEWAASRRFEDIPAESLPYLKVLVLDTRVVGLLLVARLGAIADLDASDCVCPSALSA